MSGNVWEWLQDNWHDNYEGTPPGDGTAWLTNGDKSLRVRRGGSWGSEARYVRSASRGANAPNYRLNTFGFRLAQD